MRASLWVPVALFLANIGSTRAHADEMRLADLRDMCVSSSVEDVAACKFFVYGVVETAAVSETTPPRGVVAWPCVPEKTSTDAAVFVVKTKIGQDLMFYPKDADMPAVSFVLGALADQWPCKKAAIRPRP
jgi:hypothetical protein